MSRVASPADVAAVLSSPAAQYLLGAPIPARFGYLADGQPRVVPLWFHWTGASLVLATFADSPKLAYLVNGCTAAVSIDTEQFPYRGLQVRGPVALTVMPGLVPEYLTALQRYLPEDEIPAFRRRLDRVNAMTRIELIPTWAHVLDMSTRQAGQRRAS